MDFENARSVGGVHYVQNTDIFKVKEEVERFLDEGWQMHGTPFVVREDGKLDVMHAVLIRPAQGEDGERLRRS